MKYLSYIFLFLYVSRAFAQTPDSLDTYSGKISAAMARYDYSSAVSYIDSLIAGRDSLSEVELRSFSLAKARCLKKLYKFGEAAEVLADVAAQNDVEVMGELADAYANDGKIDGALITYYALLMQQPENVFFRLQRLSLVNRKGDWQSCIEQGKELIQLDSLPQVLSIVGYAYSNLGKVDSALVYYNKAREMRPDNVAYLSSVCNLLLAGEDYEGVVSETGRYLAEINSDEPEIESIYGFASYQLKDYKKAYETFSKLRSDGDRSFATFYYSGLSSLALKKYKEAAENFGLAWQIDSTNAALAANYGTALSHYYQQDRAMEMFDKAESLLKPDPSLEFKIAYGRAYSSYVQEKFKEAIPHYKKAYALDSSYISALSTIGYCYERLKDFKAAQEWYEKYLKLGKPGSKAYQFVEESLAYVKAEAFMEEE